MKGTGYRCDGCGKHYLASIDGLTPLDWYELTQRSDDGFSTNGTSESWHFCGLSCLRDCLPATGGLSLVAS